MPVSVQLATIARELSFRHDAQPTKRIGSGCFSREVPRSSAYGYAQALDGHLGRLPRGHRAARRRPRRLRRLLGLHRLVHERRRPGERRPLHDTYNQYLAYHEGKAGYARGSYRAKAWLPAVARDVEAWAALYEQQLQILPGPLTSADG